MNRSLTILALLGLAACQPTETTSQSPLDWNEVQQYNQWLAEKKEKEEKKGFDARPLSVNATGKVKSVPDIAVITARISAKDMNESKAANDMASRINAVQAALKDNDIEMGFTALHSSVKRDEACQNANAAARRRHSEIQNDYWFNKRLDDQGDTETERRTPKPRLAQAVCDVETIEVSTDMVIRVRPAEEAGAVLKALGDADVTTARLFGYDFSDYDTLYQQAAEKAVKAARAKAEMITRVAQTELGEITNFRIQAPSRTGRFGPQPNIVNRGTQIGATNEFLARAMIPAEYETVTEPVVVQEASTELITVPATFETIYENGRARRVVKTPASTVERVVPPVTKMESRRRLVAPARSIESLTNSAQSNDLQMSLLSGPQTVSVTAWLSYDYITPIDGTIVPDES